MSVLHPHFTAQEYERAAAEYLRSLPLEHFMEGIPQGMQREISLESFALLQTRRPDVQYFNELLVQYAFRGQMRQVVPDNMLVLSTQPIQAQTNYAVELEATGPFLVMEYVSPRSERKDYDESFRKYERELKVPYCIQFHPGKQDLRVYRHDGEHYVRLEPDVNGRYLIEELDLHIGLHQHWVRFWYQGQLLELPAELQQRLDQQAKRIAEQERQIGRLQYQVQDMFQRLRFHVEKRALKAGRRDILERLPAITDLDELDALLAELE
jgi:Uma2 family endonuclease